MQVPDPEARIDHDCLAREVNRGIVVAREKRDLRRQRLVHHVQWFQLASPADGDARLLVARHRCQQDPEHPVSYRQVRTELNRLPKRGLGLRPVPIEKVVKDADGNLRFGEHRFVRDRVIGRRSGQRRDDTRVCVTIDWARRVRVG